MKNIKKLVLALFMMFTVLGNSTFVKAEDVPFTNIVITTNAKEYNQNDPYVVKATFDHNDNIIRQMRIYIHNDKYGNYYLYLYNSGFQKCDVLTFDDVAYTVGNETITGYEMDYSKEGSNVVYTYSFKKSGSNYVSDIKDTSDTVIQTFKAVPATSVTLPAYKINASKVQHIKFTNITMDPIGKSRISAGNTITVKGELVNLTNKPIEIIRSKAKYYMDIYDGDNEYGQYCPFFTKDSNVTIEPKGSIKVSTKIDIKAQELYRFESIGSEYEFYYMYDGKEYNYFLGACPYDYNDNYDIKDIIGKSSHRFIQGTATSDFTESYVNAYTTCPILAYEIAGISNYTVEAKKVAYTGSVVEPNIIVRDDHGDPLGSKAYKVETSDSKIGPASAKVTLFADLWLNLELPLEKTVKFNIVPKATTIKTVNGTSGIEVTWKKITNATGYMIYRSKDNGKTYSKIKTIKDNSTLKYVDKNATSNGTKYKYKVITYKTVNEKNYNSSYSNTKTIYRLTRPSIVSLTAKSKAIVVAYSKNIKATGYQIQYSTSNKMTSPKAVNVTSYKTTSKTIKNLKGKKKYFFRVRTYKTVSGTKYYSNYSPIKYKTTKA